MQQNEATQYRVYGIRWIQLLVYFLVTFVNALPSATFVPIESQTTTFFSITTTQVNALAVVFFFLYVLGTILATWLYRIVSMRTGLIIGSVLNLGAVIRLFALISPSRGYAALIIGQLFPAVGRPFLMNITALFAARWFAAKQRDVATAIGSMANPLGKDYKLVRSIYDSCLIVGAAIGALLPSVIVTDGTSSSQFLTLLLVEAVLTVITALLVIIIFRSEPPSPPSPSEEQHFPINIKDFISLIKNYHYLILLFSFSIGFGLFNALATLLYQLIAPFGYTSSNAGIFGAIMILTGILNAVIAGIIMDRTHAYRIILKILLVGACVSGIFFILILQPNQLYPLGASIGLIGFFTLPILPVAFECAVECTYPIRAEWSTGLLLCVGNILAGCFVFLLEYLITLSPSSSSGVTMTPASIFILCCFVIAALVLLAYYGPYLRLEAERSTTVTTTTINTADTTTTTTVNKNNNDNDNNTSSVDP